MTYYDEDSSGYNEASAEVWFLCLPMPRLPVSALRAGPGAESRN